MATAAETRRSSCAEQLEGSMRQLRRYIESEKPLSRVVKEKIVRVQTDRDELVASHHAYGAKAGIELTDATMRDFVDPKVDSAYDLIDQAELILDKQNSLQESKMERHEVDLCSEAINNSIESLRAHCTKEDATEADALFADSSVKSLEKREEQFTKLCYKLKLLLPTDNDVEEINRLQRTVSESIEKTTVTSTMFISAIRARKAAEAPTAPAGKASNSAQYRMERTKLPTFSGNPRDFARFKGDYEAIVKPAFTDPANLLYNLRENCLKGEAYQLVKNINDLATMWERLSEKYGDNMQILDSVIKDIQEVTISTKHNSDQSFVDFVDLLDRGVQDLAAIGQEREFGGRYTVTLIEKKLPRRVYMKWLEDEDVEEDEVKEDGFETFQRMLKYLRSERKKVEKILTHKKEWSKEDQKGEEEKKSKAGGRCHFNQNQQGNRKDMCIIHPNASHLTRKCFAFKQKSIDERAQLVKDLGACCLCLAITHKGNPCPRKGEWKCDESGCDQPHSKLLHGTIVTGLVCSLQIVTSITNEPRTLLLLQTVTATGGEIFAFWDSGSTISLISMRYVRKHNLKGIKVTYDLITVNNTVTQQDTTLYEITIYDRKNQPHIIKAYGIEEICQDTECIDVKAIAKLFGVSVKAISRPQRHVDLLIGNNRAPLHPVRSEHRGNLVLYDSDFGTGKVVGGEHEIIKGNDKMNAFAKVVARADIRNVRTHKPSVDFFTAEGLGVNIPPKCNNCKRIQNKCQTCNFENNQLSIRDQNDLKAIRDKMVLDPIEERWEVEYPYTVDPSVLNQEGKDNRELALKLLLKLEERLRKTNMAEKYCELIQDFIKRGIIRLLTKEEMDAYNGPRWYVSHHEVLKEGSTSTPLRLVVNTSLRFNGLSLNEILIKGPNSLNSLFSVLLNFRRYPVALIGDVKKMYHSIKTTEKERHVRRILWRDMKGDREPQTYGIETVTFGDRPAATISAVALKETAEIFKHINEDAAQKIKEDTYVDDLLTGAEDVEETISLKNNIEAILSKANFKTHRFVISGDSAENMSLVGSGEVSKVLGVGYDPQRDAFTVQVRLNLSKKVRGVRKEKDLSNEDIQNLLDRKLTRQMLMGITASCYDPHGLLAPITVQPKIELRELYRDPNLQWTDDIPHVNKIVWRSILRLIRSCQGIMFPRFIGHLDSVGLPQLIVFVDGSKSAMCAVVYIRWNLKEGGVHTCLVTAKTRVTPLKRMTIPRIELQAAVIGIRLCKTVQESIRLEFQEPIYISDSKCTLATLAKDSVVLNEFTVNRVVEVLEHSKLPQWYHVKSADNIADIGTRMNATVEDIAEGGRWQVGPDWLRKGKEEWPMSQDTEESDFPEEALLVRKVCGAALQQLVLFDASKMKSYSHLLRITARVIRCFEVKSLTKNILTVRCVQEAEKYWLTQSMVSTREALERGHLQSLRPTVEEGGIVVMASRALKGFKLNYNRNRFPILMSKDPIALLWMREVHCEEHSGVTKTLAKSRRRFWIVRGRRVAEKVRKSCYECRKLDKQLAEQQMSPLPDYRLTVAPVFNVTSLDLWGPEEIRDTVKKRTCMKVWGFIATCAATRAVYIDLTENYGTDAILQTIRRFVSVRGSPSQIISDQGSQLKSASKEAALLTKDWNWSPVSDWARAHNIDWKFVPAEGQHQNGLSESLIKSVKRSIHHVIGKNILTSSELQLMLFEIANVINSRPIGTIPSSDPECPTALTPNDLILGRSSNEVPHGPFETSPTIARRFKFVQGLIDDWWQRWYESVLPSLVPSYKWQQRHRNVRVNDICLIRYKSKVRSSYRLGRVTDIHHSSDGLVRRVTLQYRLPNEKTFRTVERAVQGIAVIVPAEEQ